MTNVHFEDHQLMARPRAGRSKMAGWVMKISGGAIKTENAANAALLIFAVIILIISFVIAF